MLSLTKNQCQHCPPLKIWPRLQIHIKNETWLVFIKLAETKIWFQSETVFGLKLVSIHKIVETKFSLRFGLKLKTGI